MRHGTCLGALSEVVARSDKVSAEQAEDTMNSNYHTHMMDLVLAMTGEHRCFDYV